MPTWPITQPLNQPAERHPPWTESLIRSRNAFRHAGTPSATTLAPAQRITPGIPLRLRASWNLQSRPGRASCQSYLVRRPLSALVDRLDNNDIRNEHAEVKSIKAPSLLCKSAHHLLVFFNVCQESTMPPSGSSSPRSLIQNLRSSVLVWDPCSTSDSPRALNSMLPPVLQLEAQLM